jgi:hypothetical protein
MKKILYIIIALFMTQYVFAQVHIGNNHPTATGSFSCTVLKPLTITTTNPAGSMGEFVKSTIPYNDGLTNNVITFLINGDNPSNGTKEGHEFWYQLTSITGDANSSAQITIDWTVDFVQVGGNLWSGHATGFAVNTSSAIQDRLDANGNYLIRGTVTSVTAQNTGNSTFIQTLTVSYNSF